MYQCLLVFRRIGEYICLNLSQSGFTGRYNSRTYWHLSRGNITFAEWVMGASAVRSTDTGKHRAPPSPLLPPVFLCLCFCLLMLTYPKLQSLVYDSLPPTTAIVDNAIGLEKLSANGQFFQSCSNGSKSVTDNSDFIRRFFYN